MKLSTLTLLSALVVGPVTQASADSLFSKLFQSRSTGEKAPLNISEQAEELSRVELATFEAPAGAVALASHNGCGVDYCDSGCGSGMFAKVCPGTGAYGGDTLFAGTIGLNQDLFFGNYTTVYGGYAITDRTDFTFYSILWHTDLFVGGPGGLAGTSAATLDGLDGIGLWTEFGAGLNFKRLGGALNINPQLGILNGMLLSNAGDPARDTAPRAFEGVVPNITVNYDDTFTEAEFYMGYYLATRSDRAFQADFLHWWINGGIKPWGDSNDWKQIISTGLHYENLRATAGDASNLYAWLGPYVQFSLPNGLGARFSAGWDVDRKIFSDDFYKVNVTYDF